jgi:hypothetical protein
MRRSREADETIERHRSATTEWLTEENLRHPEIYFEHAEEIPELNRPEERRDTLDFFVAYREKLTRDLEIVGQTGDERNEILAAIGRYDDAIKRLRRLIGTEGSRPQ